SGLVTTVEDGATLAGTGSLNLVDVAGGGHLAPGIHTGTLNADHVSFAAGSSLDVGITSAATSGYGQASVTSGATIDTAGAGVALNLTAFGMPTIHPGDRFTLINNRSSDAVAGTFAGLPEGATVTSDLVGSGIAARITYVGGDGNDVVLIVNSTPVITSSGGGATADISVPENHTPVVTVTATDPDPGQTLTYSISGGADATSFTIDSVTGALAFAAAP